MNKAGVITIVVIIILLLIGGGAIVYLQLQDTEPEEEEEMVVNDEEEEEEIEEPDPMEPPEVIEAEHFFSDGMHIVEGSIDVPTPCHYIDELYQTAESDPELVTLEFESWVEVGDRVCEEVTTARNFSLEIPASEEAEFSSEAYFDGEPVTLELILDQPEEENDDEEEPLPGETPKGKALERGSFIGS